MRVGQLYRVPVIGQKTKRNGDVKQARIGRVHMTVYAPGGKRVVGFTVSRPDIAGMVKREDVFLAYDSFRVEEDDKGKKSLVATRGDDSFDDKARQRLGIDWDQCIMWTGMDAKTVDGKELGYVDDVDYDPQTGAVRSFYVGDDGLARKLVGTVDIPVSMLRGYEKGYMVVDPAAADLELEGGLAAKAGENYAKAKVAGKEAGKKAGKAAGEAVDKGSYELGRAISRTKQAMGESAQEFQKQSGLDKPKPKKSGSTGDEAARAVGRQLGKMGSMFDSFKEEYKKASK